MPEPLDRLTAAIADHYTIERELGTGGMATVYLAEDLKHHRQVAVKVLRPDLAANLGAERFVREIAVAAKLQHPHVVPLYDSGEADGFLFYVMPFIEGTSLRQKLIREGELPINEAVRILRDLADAMAYAHQHGVVHRDIKPENILLSGRHALVTDFGVAKAVSEATGRQPLTTGGVALGTPTYMSPEQAAADPHTDHRADIYAFGVVAYELLTGRPPFTGVSPQAILAAHITTNADPVTRHRAAIPPVLAVLVMRCLEKKPADRWQSADEVMQQLEAIMTPSSGMTPTQTRPLAAVRATRSWQRIALPVLALGILAVFAWWRFGRSQHATVILGQQLPVTTEVGLEIDPALSRDGSFLAYAAGPILATRIYVRQVNGGRTVAIGDSNERQRAPRWSPDGTEIVFCQESSVVVAPALGGQGRAVALLGRAGCGGADWSPDNRHLVIASGDSLYLASADGDELRPLARVPDVHSPAWSDDGRSIAVVSGNSAFINPYSYGNSALSTIFVVPAAGGTPFAVTDGKSLAASPAWLPGARALLFVSDRDGSRDIYVTRVGGAGSPPAQATRVTTGLRTHSISVARDGLHLAYNVYNTTANIWSLPIPRAGPVSARGAAPVTHGIQYIESVSVSPDGKWVLFDSDISGRPEVFRVPVDGGEQTQLTDAPGLNFMPNASPDASEIAFQSQRNGNRDLFLMPFAGGAARPLVVGPGVDNAPQWFPDGRRIGFSHSGGGLPDGWYVIERNGAGWTQPRRVTKWYMGITLGRRGFLKVFTDSITEQSLDDGNHRVVWARQVSSDPRVTTRALYSRDESRIYFRGLVDSVNSQLGIWEFTRGGGRPRQLVTFDDPDLLPLTQSWDTDGKRFYFTLSHRESDIWVAEVKKP